MTLCLPKAAIFCRGGDEPGELTVMVDERPAAGYLFGLDDPADDQFVIPDWEVADERQREPGQNVVEHGQAENAAMPSCSWAEFRCSWMGEVVRELFLALSEQVDDNMAGRLDGHPRGGAQADGERHDRRVE